MWGDISMEHTRRKLFGSGAALVTGVLGLGFIGRRLASPEAPPHDPEHAVDASADGVVRRIELRLYGRGWQLISDAPRATWARPARGQSSIVFGELFDGPESSAGKKIGELYATSTSVNAPFGGGPLAATAVEQHTL